MYRGVRAPKFCPSCGRPFKRSKAVLEFVKKVEQKERAHRRKVEREQARELRELKKEATKARRQAERLEKAAAKEEARLPPITRRAIAAEIRAINKAKEKWKREDTKRLSRFNLRKQAEIARDRQEGMESRVHLIAVGEGMKEKREKKIREIEQRIRKLDKEAKTLVSKKKLTSRDKAKLTALRRSRAALRGAATRELKKPIVTPLMKVESVNINNPNAVRELSASLGVTTRAVYTMRLSPEATGGLWAAEHPDL